jgi:hypothetical protein
MLRIGLIGLVLVILYSCQNQTPMTDKFDKIEFVEEPSASFNYESPTCERIKISFSPKQYRLQKEKCINGVYLDKTQNFSTSQWNELVEAIKALKQSELRYQYTPDPIPKYYLRLYKADKQIATYEWNIADPGANVEKFWALITKTAK